MFADVPLDIFLRRSVKTNMLNLSRFSCHVTTGGGVNEKSHRDIITHTNDAFVHNYSDSSTMNIVFGSVVADAIGRGTGSTTTPHRLGVSYLNGIYTGSL